MCEWPGVLNSILTSQLRTWGTYNYVEVLAIHVVYVYVVLCAIHRSHAHANTFDYFGMPSSCLDYAFTAT